MLSVGQDVRIFVGVEPLDMRGSFNALAGAARRLGLEPNDGHLYLFFNRSRQLCRMLWFDGSGWCLFSKRLVRGTFEQPVVPADARQVTVDAATLASLLQGINLRSDRKGWYRRPTD